MLFVHNLLSWLGHLFLICMKIEFVINFMTPKKTVVHLKLQNPEVGERKLCSLFVAVNKKVTLNIVS